MASRRGVRPMNCRPSAASCHSERGPSPASASGAGRRFSRAQSQTAERANVAASIEQRRRGVEDGDQRAGGHEPDDLRELEADVAQRRRHRVLVALEHVGHERRPGGLERRGAERDQEEQAQQDRQRGAGDRQQRDQHRPGGVGRDEDPVPGQAVGQRREQRTAEQPRQMPDGERDRGQQRRLGALVDQHRQRHPRELVADGGQQEAAEQRAELPHAEDLAEGRLPLRGERRVPRPRARRCSPDPRRVVTRRADGRPIGGDHEM